MSALLDSVDAAKALKPDIIVVMLHWGSEATLEPTRTQESIAKQLFERGADAIIGSHSHLVGRMETMDITTDDGKEKPALWPTASAISFPARAAAMPAAARNRSF